MSRHSGLDSKVYVGDLPRDASEKEVERAFSYYGRLRNVWVARNPPGFAFVEFEDSRDAEDAVKGLDGTTLAGGRIRVELSTGKTRPKPWQRNGDRGGDRSSDRGGDRGSDRGSDRGGDRGPVGMGSRRPMSRRPFDPNDRCYECGGRGHYAYDCSRRINGSGGGGSSSRRSNRSTSRSRSRDRRSASRSRSRSRLRETRDGSRDKSRDRSRERSRGSSRGRSRGSRSRSASRSPA